MSDKIPYIACLYPNEQAIAENGARRLAYAFIAPNAKHAKAKVTLDFMQQFPEADDSDFEIKICLASDGVPCPELNTWDEKHLYENDWSDELGHLVPKEVTVPVAVDLSKLSTSLRNAVLVKYGTEEATKDMLPAALELTQEEAGTFKGHIVEALNRSDDISAMYPERILNAIGWVTSKCAPTAKWPEIKAELANWKKRLESGRKETGAPTSIVDIARQKAAAEKLRAGSSYTPGSGDPNRFDLVVAMLVMGIEPAKAGGRDVTNAKSIIESRDAAWHGWRTTLIGIPDIDTFPESLLYELTLDGMKDLSLIKDSAGRTAYVREHLAGHKLLPDYPLLPEKSSDDETEQNAASTTDVLEHDQAENDSVEQDQPNAENAPGSLEDKSSLEEERSGPFYYRTADGQVGRANKLAKLKSILEQGCEEISKEEYQALKDAPPPQKYKGEEQPEVKNLGDGRFTIDGLASEQSKVASNEAEKEEIAPAQPDSPAFQSIGAALEKDLAEKGDNLKIWRSVMRTDPRYTKDLAGAGFEGTSINAEYMIMRATEIFGPIGTGWGFEVMEDRMLAGAPMSEAIYEDKKFVGNRLLRDGDGTLITEKNHSIKIKFWYAIEGDIRGEVEAYGATKYLYKTKHGITCDGEAQKKSLTDAIKKALSLLGFSADVWLGLYDQAEYKQENAIEFDIRNASDKAEDVTRIRKELDEKFKLNTESMRSAVTPNEVSGIASSLTRVMGVHLKAARDKADNEYVKYLEGRLRRLEEVKSECLAKLQEKAA